MNSNFSLKKYLPVVLKGMAMGTADLVPGVSGGTIAFISGIYEELIETINRFNFTAIKVLRKEGIAACWQYINGNFIASLGLGILTAIVVLSKTITFLMENHPIPLWAFFFGLVLASVFFVGKMINKWSARVIIAIAITTALSFYITTLPATAAPESKAYIFLSGMVAICAMILPGISGSYILLLMGSYTVLLAAVNDRELATIGTFIAGAVVGLLSFARLLKWLFANYHNLTIGLLTGFLIGSLNKLWPWKEVTKTLEIPGKDPKIIEEVSVLPQRFADLTGQNPQVALAITAFAAGALVIFMLEKLANHKTHEI